MVAKAKPTQQKKYEKATKSSYVPDICNAALARVDLTAYGAALDIKILKKAKNGSYKRRKQG